jgi:hypothetical protein
MAAEVVKILLGAGQLLQGRMLTLNLLSGTTRIQALYSRPDCATCQAATMNPGVHAGRAVPSEKEGASR